MTERGNLSSKFPNRVRESRQMTGTHDSPLWVRGGGRRTGASEGPWGEWWGLLPT